MSYFVSRQIVWPDGTPVVEIADCLDLAGPDMLSPRYQGAGEGREYDDPREAAEAAIRVRNLWWGTKNQHLAGWDKIEITHQGSYMAAQGSEFETDTALEAWAEKAFERLPKCTECGEAIYKEKWYPNFCHCEEEFVCCSVRCAEKSNERSDDETSEDPDTTS